MDLAKAAGQLKVATKPNYTPSYLLVADLVSSYKVHVTF
jgi:hypothetical protein